MTTACAEHASEASAHAPLPRFRFAAESVAPRRRSLDFRAIEVLKRSERRVLLIVVTPDGDVWT